MDKGKLHHYWIKLKSPTLFLPIIGVVVFGSLFIYGMRYNNVTMLELKEKVIIADQQDGDIEGSLQELRDFITTHMNTNPRTEGSTEPPIQLVNEFNRAVEAEQARLAADGSANRIYQEAQAQCESGAIPLTARAQCIQEYVTENGGDGVQQLQLPPKELYTFDFASPRWSPDLAGISLILLIISSLLLVIRLAAGKIIDAKLK